MGDFLKSVNCHRYILIVIECFTKFVEIYTPCIIQTVCCSDIEKEFFSRYSVSQGTQFEGKLFGDICDLFGV